MVKVKIYFLSTKLLKKPLTPGLKKSNMIYSLGFILWLNELFNRLEYLVWFRQFDLYDSKLAVALASAVLLEAVLNLALLKVV